MKANSLKKALAVITALTMMLIFVPVMALADEAFTATFVVEGGSATIDVFYTQDYTTADETGVVSAYVRNSDTGEIDVSGEGQLNFLVNVPSGYEIASVTATEGAYKNIKDQGGNIYRITKINGDLTVTVTLQEASGEETVYVDPTVTFSGDSYSIEGSADNLEFTETTLISDGSNTVTGVEVKIAAAGTYTFTGTTSTYFIVVKKGVTGVTLVLDGVNITSHATAAITCNKTSGVTIVAAAGSVNTLQDDKYNNDDIYTDTTAYPVIENAVIKTKAGSNVVIDGTGTINVIANGKNGVKGSADQGTDTIPVFDSTSSLTIQNVTLNVTNKVSDSDSIKDEATLNILSGTITVNGVDDAIKSDFYLNIGKTGTAGPTITVNSSTEGIEGSYISVYSGNIYVTASDDGINAANGDIADRSASFTYKQYGGYVYVNCTNGDAIDSNGSATLAGGTFEVFGPSQGDGDPIDTEYGATFSGATVLAVGHNAMNQSYSGTYVSFGSTGGGMGGFGGMGGGNSSNIVTAGSTITIKDSGGNTVYTSKAASPRAASYVVFASPSLTSGSTYTLYINGSQAASATAATNSNGGGNFSGENNPGGDRPGGSTSSIWQTIISFFQRIISFFRSLFGAA